MVDVLVTVEGRREDITVLVLTSVIVEGKVEKMVDVCSCVTVDGMRSVAVSVIDVVVCAVCKLYIVEARVKYDVSVIV